MGYFFMSPEYPFPIYEISQLFETYIVYFFPLPINYFDSLRIPCMGVHCGYFF